MTKHQIDPRQFNDSDLSRHLLAARGTQWMRGNRGDPYALILRDQGIDPHPLYQGMRGRPLLRQSESDVWVTASHEAGTEILRDARLTPGGAVAGSGRRPRRQRAFGIDSGTSLKHVLSVDDALLARDRAGYQELREQTDGVLGAVALARQEDTARRVFTEALDRVDGNFDLMADFARTAPVAFFAELLGLPDSEHASFAELVLGTGGALDALLCPPTLAMTRRLVDSYDGLRSLLSRTLGDGPSADAHLLALGVGVEITSNLICNVATALLDNPEQWSLLHEDPAPAVVAATVEEGLRYAPPVGMVSRIAGEELRIAGETLGKGHQVVVLVDAANRDPEVWADPEEFRVNRRERTGHLSLTDGTPAGFVAPVVRMLTGVALETLTAGRFRGLRTNGEPVHRMRSPVMHGMARCPVATS